MVQKVIRIILAIMITIKVLVMIIAIKVMIEVMLYSFKVSKTSFLQLWANEVAMFKIFRSLLYLFKIDSLINEMLFWPKLLFSQSYLQSHMWSSFTYISGGNK